MMATDPGFPARFEGARLVFKAPQSERWDAFDTWRQLPVNLIRGVNADDATTARMVRAYRFLAMADSPHLPAAMAWGRLSDGAAWAAMTPLTEQPEPAEPAGEEVVREWAIAGARALVEARRYGVLHRFISPAAFKRGPDGQLVLSMWAVNGRVGDPDGLVTGVMPYLAPEALAGAPTTASDFYALGATLYAVATGRPPHDSIESAALAAARRTSPPSLRAARPDLSEALATTVDRLLAHDPADRLADGLAMLAALGAPLLPSLSSPPVDHEAPLERLVKAYESFQQRSGGAIIVTGAAGAGKSTVIRQFELEVALRGGLVALTRPSADEDRLSAVERWLVARGLATDAAPPGLPPEAELPAAARTVLDQAAIAHRVAEASARSRVVLVFEDLGLQEEETLLRLERLLGRHGSQVMVVATVRSEGGDGARVLARLKRNPLVRELPLGPLSEAAAVAMASYALGPDAPSLPAVKEAIGASGGHPLMLIETFRTMVADGALALEPAGWVAVTPGGHLPLAPSLDAVLTARASALGQEAWQLGAAVALLDDAGATRGLLATALDWPPDTDSAPAIQALLAQRWLTREGTGFRLAHSLLRPVLLQALDAAAQRALHARVASALEDLGGSRDASARPREQAGEADRAAFRALHNATLASP
ncbi:MAG: serine/threonine protein kinase, partial [Candidatus Sericytochromatia bacterium]